jgi:hypothetical protein
MSCNCPNGVPYKTNVCNNLLQDDANKGKQTDYHKCASCKPEYQKNKNHHCVKCCPVGYSYISQDYINKNVKDPNLKKKYIPDACYWGTAGEELQCQSKCQFPDVHSEGWKGCQNWVRMNDNSAKLFGDYYIGPSNYVSTNFLTQKQLDGINCNPKKPITCNTKFTSKHVHLP